MIEVSEAGVIKQSGSAEKEKKSGWRSFKPIVTDKCTGCTLCTQYCPEGGMKINPDTKKAEINYDYCKGCLVCVQACPSKAITTEKE
jgi:pyruvate ferredoxin oxidoreductase delta subunit